MLKKGKKDTNWALNNILKFVYFQRERVDKKEISGATVNYTKSICNVEMSELYSYSQVGVLFHRNKMNY